VVFGIYDLATCRVVAPGIEGSGLAAPPVDAGAFRALVSGTVASLRL
jgi:hypothetical protein